MIIVIHGKTGKTRLCNNISNIFGDKVLIIDDCKIPVNLQDFDFVLIAAQELSDISRTLVNTEFFELSINEFTENRVIKLIGDLMKYPQLVPAPLFNPRLIYSELPKFNLELEKHKDYDAHLEYLKAALSDASEQFNKLSVSFNELYELHYKTKQS